MMQRLEDQTRIDYVLAHFPSFKRDSLINVFCPGHFNRNWPPAGVVQSAMTNVNGYYVDECFGKSCWACWNEKALKKGI